MSQLLTLGIVLSAVDSLSPVLGNATKNLNTLDTKIGSVSANITKLGTASLAIGTAIMAPLSATLDQYQKLSSAQGELASLGIDDIGLKAITKSAREFSNEFAGTTAPEFLQASYDIKSGISSLSDTAVGAFTKTAAMTASATKSTTAEMTSLFASGYGIYRKQFDDFGAHTINGWNALSNEEKDIKFGEYFSAGISSSVQAFKTDGGNMSAALSNLGASATSAGIDFAEQLSVLGQLQATMSGSEAATKYKAFLGSVSGAGEKLDLQFTDANNQLLSMPEIISEVKNKYGDTIDALESAELKKAFGTEEAVALIKLMYNETDTLTDNINKMSISLEGGTAKTKEMAKAMNKGKEFELLGQQMNNVSTLIGGAFAPLALDLSNKIGGVVTSVGSWMEENEELTSTIVTGVAIIGGFLTVLGSVGVVVGAVGMAMPFLTGAIGMLTGSFSFLGGVIRVVGQAFLTNPIGLAITAIAVGASLIYAYWEPISNFFSSLWTGVTSIFSSGISFIKEYLGWTPLGMILNNWTPIVDFFSNLWGGVVDTFSSAWSSIISNIGSVVSFIKSPFESFFNWIASKFEFVTNIIGSVTGAITSIFGSATDIVTDVGSAIGNKMKSASMAMTIEGGYQKEKTAIPISSNTSNIERIQKEVSSSSVSSSNSQIYNSQKSDKESSKVIHNEPTYHITVTNPTSNIDVVEAMEEHDRRKRNRSFED